MEVSKITRGDIFMAQIEYNYETHEPILRPVLVIQNDVGNKYSPNVIVMLMTSHINKAKLPLHVELPCEVSGLEEDSVALAEMIKTYDKRRLKTKVGKLNEEYMSRIEKAILISIGYVDISDKHFRYEYKNYIKELTKPLIITEGKTDVMLIETAWKKLYPDTEMYFECQASGIEFEKEKRQGNAQSVRRTIEFLANIANRPVIGLFDNDREGNEQFKGVNKKIFERHSIKNNLRKHFNKNIWTMLLPVPDERKLFVTDDDMLQRYFVIEHYFSDEVLKNNKMYGRNILGTSVFQINGDKNDFSIKVKDLDAKEFMNFQILFEEINKIFKNIDLMKD